MFNQTGIFGIFIINFTNSVTGDIYLTLLTLMMIIFFFFLALRIPVEFSTILIIPLLIVFMLDGGGDWKAITGIAMLYLSIVFARFFMR
jgi:hypothetical protein